MVYHPDGQSRIIRNKQSPYNEERKESKTPSFFCFRPKVGQVFLHPFPFSNPRVFTRQEMSSGWKAPMYMTHSHWTSHQQTFGDQMRPGTRMRLGNNFLYIGIIIEKEVLKTSFFHKYFIHKKCI